jgi:hypothetical protein
VGVVGEVVVVVVMVGEVRRREGRRGQDRTAQDTGRGSAVELISNSHGKEQV